MITPQDLQAQADAHVWFHTIDLGNGVVTKGLGAHWYGPDVFPTFTGQSVLDIGAWDGYYSFLAERNGASRVVAMDHYAWGVDMGSRNAYWQECQAKGVMPDHARDLTDFWCPDLPGQRGFNFARTALGSSVEPVLADFMTTDLDVLGAFDIVLCLGVLYHLEEPLKCLKRVRSLTRQVAVIETEALHIHDMEDASLLQFYAGNTLHADFGNWYAPTIEALHAMCRAAGFSTIHTVAGPPDGPSIELESRRERLSRRVGGLPRRDRLSAPTGNYRALVHALV
jgi:tRNA (mo5U34)-methyltransferase